MRKGDIAKLKRDPRNNLTPYIGYDKSMTCALWNDHSKCNGEIMIGQTFHVYCDCECHKKKAVDEI